MIRCDDHGAVRVLTLDRPEKRNALTVPMLDRLKHELVRAQEPEKPIRALALLGAGATFCAGFDLTACKNEPRELEHLLRGLAEVLTAMRSAKLPIVVGAHGAAIAGGCAMLGGADVVVASRTTTMGYPVARLGISPAVSAPFLSGASHAARTGPARAAMLDARTMDAPTFARVAGIAMNLVERDDEVGPAAIGHAQQLAAKGHPACAATKELLLRIDRATDLALAALDVSLSLVGGPEERAMLPRAWTKA